jgi:hypothetical protein
MAEIVSIKIKCKDHIFELGEYVIVIDRDYFTSIVVAMCPVCGERHEIEVNDKKPS